MSVSSAVSLNPPVLDAGSSVNIAGGTASQIPYQTAPNTTAFLPNGTAGQVLTSNGAGAPTWNTVPAVSTPTLAQVLTAGNTAGSSSIDMNGQDITGADAITATTFNGALNGNASTATSATTSTNIAGGLGGSIPYQSAVDTTALLANGTAGQVLTSAGTTLPPTWTTPSGGSQNLSQVLTVGSDAGGLNITNVGSITATTFTGALTGNASTATSATSATSATTSTNIAGGSAGNIPYQSGAGTTALLASGTAGQVLTSGGAGAPTWTTIPSSVTSNYFAYNSTAGSANITGNYTYNTTALSAGTYLITYATTATNPVMGPSLGNGDLSVAVLDSSPTLLFENVGQFDGDYAILSALSGTAIITTSGVLTFTISIFSSTAIWQVYSLNIAIVQIA